MRNDSDIYNKIGQLLFNISPNDANKVYLKAKISQENDHCKFIFYYENKLGQEKPIILPSGCTVDDDLFDELIALRKYTLENNLTNGNPIWVGCIVTIDIENSKINIDFKYEPFIEE